MVGWVVADKALQIGISFCILVYNFWVGVFAKALFSWGLSALSIVCSFFHSIRVSSNFRGNGIAQ